MSELRDHNSETAGYITEQTACFCYRGLSHTVCIVANRGEIVLVLFFILTGTGMCFVNSFYIVRHSVVLTLVIVRHFGL